MTGENYDRVDSLAIIHCVLTLNINKFTQNYSASSIDTLQSEGGAKKAQAYYD